MKISHLRKRNRTPEQDRNDFFMEEIYKPYRDIFRIWGYKFSRSIGMTPDEAEAEAIKIALEQTDIRMGSLDEFTVAHVLHATKQRLLNLCKRNSSQKRNIYVIDKGYYCDCGRKLQSSGICECGLEVTTLSERKYKKLIVSMNNMRDEGESDEDDVGYSYSKEHINGLNLPEEIIYLEVFLREFKKEIEWRFKTQKVRIVLITIYELLVEDRLEYNDICRLMNMEDSTFFLYRSRLQEVYFSVRNRLEGKFKKENMVKRLNECINR